MDSTPGGQRGLIDFALVWYPYGGGSEEDIFVRFGLTARDYFLRLLEALEDEKTQLDAANRSALVRMCRMRLAPGVDT